LSRPEPLYPAGTSVNYLLGKDSSAWKTDVPAWGAVVYRGAYPGYDLEVSGGGSAGWQWRLLPLLREAPGLDTGALPELALQVDGAGSLTVAGDKLLAATGIGTVALPLLAGSGATPLVNGQTVTAPYATPRDASEGVESQAVEDLIYYRTLGVGTVSSEDDPIAVDAAGSVYVTGYTNSSDFPTTTGAYDTELSGSNDAFVTKLNSTGTSLVYSTFLGGTGPDRAHGIALDAAGNAYITGHTFSSDFPTSAGAPDTELDGSYDAFVTKLNSAGTALVYSTFLGGTSNDLANGIALDSAGNAYITGYTYSSDFPTAFTAYDTGFNGSTDAFVTKLNSTGTALVYSTFLGGTSNDRGNGIALDSAGNAYITGYTQSSGFPTTSGAYDTSFNHSTSYEDDAFVTKLNSTGTALVYSTFLGSTSTDLAYGITVDSAGNAYTTGSTNSSGFPTTAGALDTELNGSYDAFVTKLNSAGTDAVYSTFLGGTSSDYAYGVTVDSAGNAFITGSTNSSGFPTTAGAYDTQPNGGAAGFVTRLNAAGTALLYSTFLGSSSSDHAYGIAATDAGRAYVVGEDPAGLFVASLQCGAAAGEPIPSGFLDFPVAYDTFSVSALGFPQSGRVTAWFDHSASADTMKTWRGIPISESAGVSVDVLDCGTGSDRCYDGHTGTDISAATTEVRAAAAGTAYGVYRTCGTNEQGCNDGWGNTVRIDHGNGYATLYAHLAQVDAAVVDGAPVTNQQRLGTMGETGNAFGAHLHFGVYAKVAGNWVAVDPYGLRSTLGLTGYLWRESLSANATVTTAGASGQSPSGQAAFNAPAGSVTEPITFELWDAPVAAPSAQLNPSIQQRSTGHSFWMRVLEWLGLQSLESAGPSLQAQSGLFATPVTISVRFGPRDIRHLDMSQLSLYRWDETSSVWIRLPTTVDAGAGLASAQTDRPGEFDLQAPLLCAADAREPDDTFYNAEALSAPGSSTRLLDIADDEDWVVFSAVAGQRYIIQTSGLGPGLETVVEVYDSSGLTLLAADDNGGGAGASRLSWTPTRSDDYFVRVVPAAGSSVGCSGTYTLSLAKAADATPTPTTTTPSPTPSATPQVAPTGTPPAPGGTTVYLPLTLRTE